MLVAYLYFLYQQQLLTYYYSALLFGHAIGLILFHSQHTFDSAKRKKGITHFESAMYGASFLQVPEYLKWVTGSIEYHHIHHLSVAVPLYNLRPCHDEAPPGMFDDVKRITFWEGLESLKYTLYDEEQDRLISFDEYETTKH
jgi:omega-6 fatty acid desaturase (delta-12 desaturase)